MKTTFLIFAQPFADVPFILRPHLLGELYQFVEVTFIRGTAGVVAVDDGLQPLGEIFS